MSVIPFGRESDLQAAIEAWFSRIGLPFDAQRKTRSGRCDLALYNDQARLQSPWCVLEIKNGLNPRTTKLAELADYFEQCVKYQLTTRLPVFLGPVFIPTMGIDWCMQGGVTPPTSVAAFSAYAGRVNVGLFFVNAPSGRESDPAAWRGFRMTMRQQTVARWHEAESSYVWPESHIDLMSFDRAPSASIRTAA